MIVIIDFSNHSYLKQGDDYQRHVFDLLNELQIMMKLHFYQPILAGTIPIGIYIEASDIDILCHVEKIDKFQRFIADLFRDYPAFHQKTKRNYTITSFFHKNIPIEIFGQDIPTKKQNGYRHMLIEHRLLSILSTNFKNKLLELKRNGLKTEPAFSKLLQMNGDPYEELLLLEKMSNMELKNKFSHLIF